ncbi:MAG TPA: YceI family protein [Candidatus Kapabacteria bacterium]|nr:YceI family protein [Candidatus Kapabacteria bacterium]
MIIPLRKRNWMAILLFISLAFAGVSAVRAQAVHYTIGKKSAELTVLGTSTLQNWSMTSHDFTGDAEFDTAWSHEIAVSRDTSSAEIASGDTGLDTVSIVQLKALPSLTVTVPVQSLKSYSSELDENAYRALDADRFHQIIFTLTAASITPPESIAAEAKADPPTASDDTGEYSIVAQGYLAVAGETKPVTLLCKARLNWDGSISVSGTTTINMTYFGVTPPTLLKGAIETGDAIRINFALIFVKEKRS